MSISKTDVLKVAKLSRLALSDAEVTTYTEQFTKILQHVESAECRRHVQSRTDDFGRRRR